MPERENDSSTPPDEITVLANWGKVEVSIGAPDKDGDRTLCLADVEGDRDVYLAPEAFEALRAWFVDREASGALPPHLHGAFVPVAKVAALRAELAEVRVERDRYANNAEAHRAVISVHSGVGERLRAEIERMRPVVDAAFTVRDAPWFYAEENVHLVNAVDAYRAASSEQERDPALDGEVYPVAGFDVLNDAASSAQEPPMELPDTCEVEGCNKDGWYVGEYGVRCVSCPKESLPRFKASEQETTDA